jgi:hypothetical protein
MIYEFDSKKIDKYIEYITAVQTIVRNLPFEIGGCDIDGDGISFYNNSIDDNVLFGIEFYLCDEEISIRAKLTEYKYIGGEYTEEVDISVTSARHTNIGVNIYIDSTNFTECLPEWFLTGLKGMQKVVDKSDKKYNSKKE